ncbi:MAG TPA: MFS transporter, partial [Actinophytocola sp.]|nr:MFS transporter [Actinophytocola sp.]
TARTNGLLAGGTPPAEALTSGFRLAFWVGAVMVATAVVLAVTMLRRPARDVVATGEAVPVGAAP